jgi:hypothetical protein
MNLDRLRKRAANGFQPFTLHLSDGRKFPVRHPEFIAVGRNIVVVIGDDDFANVIDPLHIVSIGEPSNKEE